MSLSLYEITVPVMIAGFGNMSKFLDRGRTYADEKDIAHVKLLNARLADDMMSLVEQVQRASDTAKRAAVRVGLVDNCDAGPRNNLRGSAGANQRDSLFPRSGAADRIRTTGRRRASRSAPWWTAGFHRLQLFIGLRASELLLPYHNGVRPASSLGCADRQTGLSRLALNGVWPAIVSQRLSILTITSEHDLR